MNRHAGDGFAIERTEVSLVACDECLAAESDCRGEHGAIFFGYGLGQLDNVRRGMFGGQVEAGEYGILHGNAVGYLRGEIPSGFLADVGIRPALVSLTDQRGEQLPNGTI